MECKFEISCSYLHSKNTTQESPNSLRLLFLDSRFAFKGVVNFITTRPFLKGCQQNIFFLTRCFINPLV
nr:hypothetical protein Iba_chr02bCG17880 [Ipomoea batatas]